MLPPIGANDIGRALYGATRLARGDTQGIDFFEDTEEGFWRSFWAAVVVAPAYAILVAIELSDAQVASGWLRILLVEIIAYVAGWAAFPLAMHYVAEMIDREEQYFRYICANNWAIVLQVTLFLFVTALLALEILPRPVAVVVSVVAYGAIFVYQWFVAKVGLDLSGRGAVGIVALDFVISLVLNAIVRAML